MSSSAEHLQVIEGEGGGAAPQDALVGKTIDGRYEVERVLGEGGMGLVYRGRHIVLNKPLAVKVLRPDVSRDEEIITRFRQEAQSASAIGNQHIIDISDFGSLPDGSTYFIMEYLDGSDLTKVIERQSPIAPNRIVHIMKQLCDALGAAHDAGIVHRDLKPDNIYLIKRGQETDFVKVLDFGIAKVGGTNSKLTRAGQVFGTPHYMSPEQCAGTGVDHRTDLYAIGIILYEMVCGRTPFDADNLMGILTKHLYEAPVPPTQLRPDCPKDLESIILKCIAKKQDERYQNCRELHDDLVRVEGGLPPLAKGSTFSAVPSIPGTTPTPTLAPAAEAKGSSGKLIGIAAAVLLLGGGGAAAFFMTQKPAQVVPPPVPVVLNAPPANANPNAQQNNNAQGAGNANGSAAPAAAKVRIITEPEGAEVWSGAELLGQTPLDVPRPTGTDRLALELKASGFTTREVAISAQTLAPELRFRLDPARSSGGGGSRAPSTSMTSSSGGTSSPPPPAMMGGGGEVIDPWAN